MSQPKESILLPNFSITSDEVKLGYLLPPSRNVKLPEPERILNADTAIEPKKVSRDFEVWSSDEIEGKSVSAGVWANIATLTMIGAGASVDWTKTTSLLIDCGKMTLERFAPDENYIDRALKSNPVKRHISKHWRPAVYMVTGMMKVHKPCVKTTTNRKTKYEGSANADATCLGIPINIGPEGSFGNTGNQKIVFKSNEPFVLAYRLRKLRPKSDGSFKQELSNKWALFDDTKKDRNQSSPAGLSSLFENEDVHPETEFDS